MNYILITRLLKYIDCFGTKFNFYTERSRKLYTALGGILSFFSILCGTLIFLIVNLDELRQNVPISSTSVIQEHYHNIKFGEEKIWIPWRLRDYEGHMANFTGLLYPIIYYYTGKKNNTENGINLQYSFLNYKLCSETSMINNSNYFTIDVPLNELYCIDMENLEMGGNWDYDFVNYVEFDLYMCKNGIDYDENNKNCTSYEDLIQIEKAGSSLEFEVYYPLVHYQPLNKTKPIFVKYIGYFYLLSRYTNKIDRIYLQKHVLLDDRGFVSKDEETTKFWGSEKFSGDSYASGDKKDLMSEGSSSRMYSLNIYLNFETVLYHRYYKKFFLILAEGLPIVYILFNFFKFIAKAFKISSGNKKLTELLFENLQEKPSRIRKQKITELNFTLKKSIKEKKNHNETLSNSNINFIHNKLEKNIHDNNINSNKYSKLNKNNNNTINNINNISEFSLKHLNHQYQLKNSIKEQKDQKNSKENHSKTSTPNKKLISNTNIKNNNKNKSNGNSQTNSNSLNFNFEELFIDKTSQSGNSIFKKDNSSELNKSNKSNLMSQRSKRYYVQKKLFPYKYYLCSIFIRTGNSKKKSCFYTRKFIVVYNFICQLFDISSYLILQKEFQIMKNKIIVGKYKDLLESNQKINVNAQTFNIDMKECLDSNKFSILGRVKEKNEYA